jgi:hypothetical protein
VAKVPPRRGPNEDDVGRRTQEDLEGPGLAAGIGPDDADARNFEQASIAQRGKRIRAVVELEACPKYRAVRAQDQEDAVRIRDLLDQLPRIWTSLPSQIELKKASPLAAMTCSADTAMGRSAATSPVIRKTDDRRTGE